MAIEYRLTLAGEPALGDVAERAFPDTEERPTETSLDQLLSADLYERCGFGVTVSTGDLRSEYGADGDDGAWNWAPGFHVNITFRFDKFIDESRWQDPFRCMLGAAKRLLESGKEDAALVGAGDLLLLTRMNGELRKHNRVEWWDHYGFVNEIIDG